MASLPESGMQVPDSPSGEGETPLAGLRVGFFSWQESNASCKPCFSGTVVLTSTMKQRRRKSAVLLLSELPCRWPGWSFAGGFSPPAGWRESRPDLGRLGQLWLLVISLGVASPDVLTFGATLSLTGWPVVMALLPVLSSVSVVSMRSSVLALMPLTSAS